MPSKVVEVLAALDAALQSIGARWYLFGAQAAILYGAARLTADVDATIDLGNRPIAALLTALHRHGFEPRIDDPADFAARTHVLPAIHRASGMGLDLVMAGTGIEALFFARSRRQQVEGVSIPVASPEDIIVMKILAGRPKDLDDAGAILAAQGEGTDVELVRQTLRELEQALDRSDLVAALHSLLGKIAQ
jgi:hypothetical protein